MSEELRTIELNGVVIGQVQERWVQTDPYTWVHQWDLVGSQICFDTFEEASAYVHGRHDGMEAQR